MTNIQVKPKWLLTVELQLDAVPIKQEGIGATTRKEEQQTKETERSFSNAKWK